MLLFKPRAYSLLPESDSDDTTLSADKSPLERTGDCTSVYAVIFVWACYGCVLCSVVNILVIAADLYTSHASVTVRLPRPNVYIGLERVHRNASSRALSFPNFPSFMSQIDSQQPERSFPEHSAQWLTFEGTVWPDERRFFVSGDGVSTVAQFRIRDFGFERCQMVAQLPAHAREFSAASKKHMKSLTVSARPSQVEVWSLESNDYAELGNVGLTYRRKPRRRSRDCVLAIAEGMNATCPEFYCRAGSLLTFEFACQDSTGCLLDFYQDERAPEASFYLLQKATM